MSKAITVTDLGFGDAGKGSLTDALVRKHDIKLVVRSSGGSNCAHNVITPENVHHTFSTWGSGSLAGASTLLTKDVVIDPIRLMNEGMVLNQKGVVEPFKKMMIDENALVITPFHRALNRIRELGRGVGNRHGSCGIGVGETVRYSLSYPERALRIGDLKSRKITSDKLGQIRIDLHEEAHPLYKPDWMKAGMREEMILFSDENLFDALMWRFHQFMTCGISLLTTPSVLSEISRQDTVWEGAQGVLLDEDVGFHPYTTWSRSRLINATETLEKAGIKDVTNIGILRAYGHRHGPGPFPSEDDSIRSIVAEPHNGTNDWQKSFRVGWFDMVMAKYALSVAGRIDQLALTHVDKLRERQIWPIVTDYEPWPLKIPADDFNKRERMTAALMGIKSEERKTTAIHNSLIPTYISSELGLPITISSCGPAFGHKTFI